MDLRNPSSTESLDSNASKKQRRDDLENDVQDVMGNAVQDVMHNVHRQLASLEEQRDLARQQAHQQGRDLEDARKLNNSLREKLATRVAQVRSYKDIINNLNTTKQDELAVKLQRVQQVHEQAIQEIQAILVENDDVNVGEDHEDSDEAGLSNCWTCDHCKKKLKTREEKHLKTCTRLAEYR